MLPANLEVLLFPDNKIKNLQVKCGMSEDVLNMDMGPAGGSDEKPEIGVLGRV